jgi:hypothetical protein
MKIKRERQNEPEVFGAVVDALRHADDEALKVQALDEEDSYGDRGTITIRIGERRFQIELHEIL